MNFSSIAGRLAVALALGAGAASAGAVPALELRLEDLLPMAPAFKAELKLNANQQILWQQVEGKTRLVLRERLSRREHVQAALKAGLAAPKAELRDLIASVDAETAASAAEEKQLREWWLTVNDALDENQRQAVANFLGEQLLRVPDSGPQHSVERPKGDAARGARHGGKNGGVPGV
ncbi:hypothetical protein AAKU55_000364 [Oxalobacteraceae bacterium GrIS 1.11]